MRLIIYSVWEMLSELIELFGSLVILFIVGRGSSASPVFILNPPVNSTYSVSYGDGQTILLLLQSD